MTKFFKFSLLVSALFFSPARAQTPAHEHDPLAALTQVLARTTDVQFQLDVLKGLSAAFKGQRSVPMPAGWEQIETQLGASPSSEVRSLSQSLSVTFGSSRALAALRKSLQDKAGAAAVRRAALDSLVAIKDAGLPPILLALLDDQTLRDPALRALAGYDAVETPAAILAAYDKLDVSGKRDALNTLSSRLPYAKVLAAALSRKQIPAKDLTADLTRQLRNLKDREINDTITKVWGVSRDTAADKVSDINKYKKVYRAGGSTPGDASRGRLVFTKTCQQCHTLFDTGGKVGPDLTGSNRADLDYILQNIVDPNAVIPNEYRSSTLETKDDRVITGIVKNDSEKSVTIVTANESIVIPRNEIKSIYQSEISMMPEGLLTALTDQEVRDLIYYLGRPGQVPLP